jgi:isochorismate hydrolase
MAIPAIRSYPMPPADELPENTVNWTADPARAVLLIHDMQHYFLAPFPRDASPTVELLDHVARLRTRCTQLSVPITYTAQPGSMTDEQRGLLKDFWGPGMTASAEHRLIPESISPAEHDTVFTKWRASAFFGTELLELLRDQRRDQLIVCGVYAHVGILMTANDGLANDIQTFVVADAIADFTAEDHRFAVEYTATRCGMAVTTDTVLTMLNALTPAAFADAP